MRILAVSDMHLRKRNLERALEQQPNAKTVIFLGDGIEGAEEVFSFYPDRTFYSVPGNCDYFSLKSGVIIKNFENVKIMATHGHLHSVKSGTSRLLDAAKGEGVQIALYGHTHNAKIDYEDGIYLINPGTVGGSGEKATYCVIDITPAGILPAIIEL